MTLGEHLGFLIGYLLFTTVFFGVLTLLGKLPEGWSFVHVAAITLCITGSGRYLRRYLSS